MFIQIIQGHVNDADRFLTQADRWPTDLKPGAIGYLGCTWGLSGDGTGFLAARFDSEAAANANGERPEQGEWWEAMAPAFGDVSFLNCAEVDTMMGGGSDGAGFVQVIQGRVTDQQAARMMFDRAEGRLVEARPDILGGVVAWHGTGGDFTQIVYFRSADEAHAAESATEGSDVDNEYREVMAAEPSFIDLTDPRFD